MTIDRDADMDRIRRAVGTLREFFDCVQVFALKEDDAHNTVHCHYGAGNWFARFGHIKSFVNDTEKGYILGEAARPLEDNKKEWED